MTIKAESQKKSRPLVQKSSDETGITLISEECEEDSGVFTYEDFDNF